MEAKTPCAKWKVLLAFAIIYFVWGSTFLAIRVGVREVPPFILAAILVLAIISFVPETVLWLPRVIGYKG